MTGMAENVPKDMSELFKTHNAVVCATIRGLTRGSSGLAALAA